MNEDKCPGCGANIDKTALEANLRVCPACGYHFRMEPVERLAYLADPGSFEEMSSDLRTLNPIDLAGYEEKLSEAEAKSRMKEAVITGTAAIDGRRCVLGLMSFTFMGGSMGSVVGE
jgi:acetyl-CoA carboxylase carboxyl transferase subunit beta